MREAMNRATEVHFQNALLSSHQTHLQNLDRAVQASRAAIISRFETSVVRQSTVSTGINPVLFHTSKGLSLRTNTRRQSSRTFRLALPRWLSNCVWEFAMQECEAGWDFQLHPVKVRQYGSLAFDVVRSGNVGAVKKLLAAGDLSVSDRESGFSDASPFSVAAELGHLELCEFLLQEFAILRSDAQIYEALTGFIEKCYLMSPRFGGYDDLTEAFYELFLSKHGFSPDLNDTAEGLQANLGTTRATGYIRDEYISSSMLLTERTLQNVIASQAVPFDQWPLTHRFQAAINSRGWPAESFVRLVNFDTITHLAQHKDTRGRTALHWAAEQFGTWMSEYEGRASWNRIQVRRLEYGELLMKLIVAGADVYALDSADRTPFTCMLMSSATWTSECVDHATRVWGDMLREAGGSLQAYVEHENISLAKIGNATTPLYIVELGHIWTCQLIILECSTLVIEAGGSFVFSLWEHRPPPGAWRQNDSQVDKIIWEPNRQCDGDDWYLWQSIKEFRIKSLPNLLCIFGVEFTLGQSIAQSWKAWITGSQDDHGFVAMTLQRDSDASVQRGPRRRAASLPPPITISHEHIHRPIAEVDIGFTWGRWLTNPHKCPLDLSWKSRCRSSPYDHPNDYRRCMQGFCDRPQHKSTSTDHWEALLLDDERNIEIARRFVDRFHPTWRNILEKNHLKAQRRAELEISVA